MIKLGILGSTNGTDLQAIFEAEKTKKLNAKVNVVISNKENSYILKRAKNHGVPAVFINHKNKKRKNFDSEISIELKKNNIDLKDKKQYIYFSAFTFYTGTDIRNKKIISALSI